MFKHGAQEALCAANAATAMQEFQCIHGKEDAGVFVGFLCQGDGILQACTIFERAGDGENLKAKRHGNRLAIHHMDFFSG